jgi:taurine transport system ATP-binding protein
MGRAIVMRPAAQRDDKTGGRSNADANNESLALDLKSIHVWFDTAKGQIPVLENISLTVQPGEFVCIIGPSGCGKSTLMHLAAGLVTPSQGTIRANGALIQGPCSDRSIVTQRPTLLPWRNIRRNVEIGPRAHGLSRARSREIADRYLELANLSDFADKHPYELSGGMKQRVAFARALANEPSLMLMDEPFGALDALTRESMQLELLRIWDITGRTIVLVTHDVEEVVVCGTRVIAMSPRPGRIALDQQLTFSKKLLACESVEDTRSIRSSRDFVLERERIANAILRY